MRHDINGELGIGSVLERGRQNGILFWIAKYSRF